MSSIFLFFFAEGCLCPDTELSAAQWEADTTLSYTLASPLYTRYHHATGNPSYPQAAWASHSPKKTEYKKFQQLEVAEILAAAPCSGLTNPTLLAMA